MKTAWIVLCFLLSLVMFLGCYPRQDTTVQQNLVTQITITCQTDTEVIERRYTSQEKMRSVLLYIRSVDSPFDAPQQPQEEGRQVCITTTCADQSQKVYWQMGERYFREGEGNWRLIDSEKGAYLWTIIKLLPSDPEVVT